MKYTKIEIFLLVVMFISQANVPKNYIDGYYKDFLIENVALRLAILIWAIYLYVKENSVLKHWIGAVVLVIGINFPVSLILHWNLLQASVFHCR